MKSAVMKSNPAIWHSLLAPIALLMCLLGQSTTSIALPNGAGSSNQSGQNATIQFPSRSIGKLFTLSPAYRPLGLPSVGAFYAQASGLVRLKPGLTFKFEPNMLLCEQSKVLGAFPADTLQYLDLCHLEVTDPLLAAIGKLHSLRALSLEETDLDDDRMKMLGDLANLQFINLSKNLVKGPGLRYLTASKDIRRVDLSFNTVERDIGQNLAQFPKLGSLILNHSSIRDSDLAGIAKLQLLEHLKISSNRDITDNGMIALVPLKHLHTLEVDETNVTPAGLLALKGAPLLSIYIGDRYNDKTTRALLHKAFPGAEIHFNTNKSDIPIEFFAPLH
jgi:hypothetical protein